MLKTFKKMLKFKKKDGRNTYQSMADLAFHFSPSTREGVYGDKNMKEVHRLKEENFHREKHIRELEYKLNEECEHIQDLMMEIEDLKKRNKKLNITNKGELLDIENE